MGQSSKWLPRGIASAGSFRNTLLPGKGFSALPFSCAHVLKGSGNLIHN